MPKWRYAIMTRLHAEGRHARPRHDVPDLHRAGQPRFRLGSRHGEEAARRAGAAADRDRAVRQFALRRGQAERASLSFAPRSGATPTPTAPACCPSPSRTASASSAMSTTRSTCRCISSSAATATSTSPAQSSATSWPAGSPQLPGERATMSDWANHLSTIFPEVRLKSYLEMRGADGGPGAGCRALPAFWVGLLYDERRLDAAWELVKDWTAEERQALRDDVPRLGLKATIARPQPARGGAADCSPSPRRVSPAVAASTGMAATRRTTSIRCTRSSPPAAPPPRRCWRNSTAPGAAPSTRSSPNTRTNPSRPGPAPCV